MANRSAFAVAGVVFLLVLASGPFKSNAADSYSPPAAPAEHAMPLTRDNSASPDLPDVNEGPAAPADTVAAEGSRSRAGEMIDAWAEAFAESSRLWGKIGAVTNPPLYQVVVNKQVQFFLERFTNQHRKLVGNWINRSGQYLGMIRDVLKKHDLPEDLAFTAMIESGFNPLAVSRAGAKGLWQFMAGTARRYGLRVDQWVDERLDPEKSTVAAAAYLRDLHGQFGSWFLAQAAYNAGEVTVARAIRATGSNDFWTLTRTRLLRQETKEFVPAILAATMIGRDPARYGFEPVSLNSPAIDRVAVPPSTDLRRLSLASGISPDMLRSLNPVLIRGITPPGSTYDLRVPVGTRGGVLAAIATPAQVVATRGTLKAAQAERQKSTFHVVRRHDTVTSIARRYRVTIADILRWNGLEPDDRIRPGDRLRVADPNGAERRTLASAR